MWTCASTIGMVDTLSRFLEVDPLVHRESLELAAQAVEPHLGGAQADPLAPAENAATPGLGAVRGRDGQADGATEVDPVRAVVEIDQHRQRVRGAGPASRRLRHRLGRLARQLARRGPAVEADARVDLAEVAGDDAAPDELLGAGDRGEARHDVSAGERLDDRQRALTLRQLGQDDALQRLLVLGHDEVAHALAHLGLDRRQLAADVVHVLAADGQLGLELRVVGAEAELDAAVRRDRKSTRLNSSHMSISYAVFCLKKKKKLNHNPRTIKKKHKTK